MKKNRLIGIILAITAIPIGIYGIYYSYNNYFKDSQPQVVATSSSSGGLTQTEINQYVKTHSKDITPSVSSIEAKIIADYNKAKSMSPYVAGWIYIEGTTVNYPVMAGKSYDYWLNYNWLGEKSKAGSIILDERQLSLDNMVTFINGHNMSSSYYTSNKPFCGGTRFAPVRYFLEMPGFFQDADKHRIFTYDGQNIKVYQVFSTYKVPCTYQVEVNFQNKSQVQAYAKELRAKSEIAPPPYNGGDLLILNTCYVDRQQQHIITVAQQVNV